MGLLQGSPIRCPVDRESSSYDGGLTNAMSTSLVAAHATVKPRGGVSRGGHKLADIGVKRVRRPQWPPWRHQ